MLTTLSSAEENLHRSTGTMHNILTYATVDVRTVRYHLRILKTKVQRIENTLV